MEKNILYIGNIAGKKMTGSFSGTAIKAAQSLGFSFHSVANRRNSTQEQITEDEKKFGIVMHHADITRFPITKSNIVALKQIIKIIKSNNIQYLHCNTPSGGLLGRIAGKKCGVKKVIYQAHGFHFYKGAPLVNWLLYYPAERLLAHYTDALITINQEDYERAQQFHLRNHGNVYYVPGVGINLEQFKSDGVNREQKRLDLGLKETDIMVISAGDLIRRKNYETSIKAIARANDKRIHYFICGQGPLLEELKRLAVEQNVEKQVHFLGYRTDIKELLASSDIFLFSTLQEGLPRSLSEAMACGLPCVVSEIRGNIELVHDGENGYTCDTIDCEAFANKIKILADNDSLRMTMSKNSREIIKNFDTDTVQGELLKIYKNEFC